MWISRNCLYETIRVGSPASHLCYKKWDEKIRLYKILSSTLQISYGCRPAALTFPILSTSFVSTLCWTGLRECVTKRPCCVALDGGESLSTDLYGAFFLFRLVASSTTLCWHVFKSVRRGCALFEVDCYLRHDCDPIDIFCDCVPGSLHICDQFSRCGSAAMNNLDPLKFCISWLVVDIYIIWSNDTGVILCSKGLQNYLKSTYVVIYLATWVCPAGKASKSLIKWSLWSLHTFWHQLILLVGDCSPYVLSGGGLNKGDWRNISRFRSRHWFQANASAGNLVSER